ncbi:MAG TPA: ribosome small subunit-dependent GTPase A [Candidatus Angelobacter sp.]
MQLQLAGWNESWSELFSQQFNTADHKALQPARVLAQHRQSYSLWTASGEANAEVAGAFLYRASAADLPAVGDWVAVRQYSPADLAIITGVLPRKTCFSRKVSGPAPEEQVIAANIDLLFIVCGLDHDYNLRRLERYLVAARQSGAAAIIVLNKVDLCGDIPARLEEVQAIAPGTSVVAISATSSAAALTLLQFIAPGQTGALVGSSGAGKSTIVNQLLGTAVQTTQPTRTSDSRGRHTTTHRELFFLPHGGLILDNPGLRELQLWSEDFYSHGASATATSSLLGHAAAVDQAFPEIEVLAARCAFRDCSHSVEPGCSVQAALTSGQIDAARWRSYLKLGRELRHAAVQLDQNLRRTEKERWKKLCKEVKRNQKRR